MNGQRGGNDDGWVKWLDAYLRDSMVAWTQQACPRIEFHLIQAPAAHRGDMLRLLIGVELGYRRQDGQVPTIDEYERRFPGQREAIQGAFECSTAAWPPSTQAATHDEAHSDTSRAATSTAASQYQDGSIPNADDISPVQGTSRPGPDPLLRYRIERTHAMGGLGEVFVAQDEALNREVALKRIHPRLVRSKHLAGRFRREAEITGRLEHPNVVPVYDIGTRPNGEAFYVMRFIRGKTLDQALRDYHGGVPATSDPSARSLALRGLLRHFVDVCNAIAYAHDRGVMHRDIKPSNIMIGPFGETVVLDWGLAKVIGKTESSESEDTEEVEPTLRPDAGSDLPPTVAGSVVGTPEYAAPEVAEGDQDRVGTAADIYSLGATLYALLAGRAPFRGSNKKEVLARVIMGTFPRPRQVAPGVSRPLEAVCLKAMALQPCDRYGSVRALAQDIERWLGDEPVTAQREPWTARAGRWVRRHRSWAAASFAVLLISVVALSGALHLIGKARAEASSNFDGSRSLAVNMLVKVAESDLTEAENVDTMRVDIAREAVLFLDALVRQRPNDPSVGYDAARANRVLGNALRLLGDEEADAAYQRAVDHFEHLIAADPSRTEYRVDLSYILVDWGEQARMQGAYANAERRYLRAIDLMRPLAPTHLDHLRTMALAQYNLGSMRLETGDVTEACAIIPDAVAAFRILSKQPSPMLEDLFLLPYILTDYGAALQETRRWADAGAALTEAMERLNDLEGDLGQLSDFGYARTIADLQMGRLRAASEATQDEAHALFCTSIERVQTLVADYPDVPHYRQALGEILLNRAELEHTRGQAEDAAGDAEHVRVLLERPLDEDGTLDPSSAGLLGRAIGLQGLLAQERGDDASARSLMERAVTLQRLALQANPGSLRDVEALQRHNESIEQLVFTPSKPQSP